MWASSRRCQPSFSQARTKRRKYRFASRGETTPPCGTPRLRGASLGSTGPFHHRHPQPGADQGEHAPVRDPPPEAAQQRPVRDRAEVVAEVSVHHLPPPALGDVEVGPADRHLGPQPGAEPVLLGREVGLDDGPEHQQRRRLGDAVADARDPERPLAAIALRYPDPQEGPRAVGPGPQLLPQRSQPSLQPPGLDRLESLAIDPRGAGVTPAMPVGFGQDVRTMDLVPEAVEAEGRFRLSFRPQRGLQLPKPSLATLLDSWSIVGLSLLRSLVSSQGPFPPPALPGLDGTTGPSAICPGRPRSSRTRRCRAPPRHPGRLPLLRVGSSPVRAATTTPAGSPAARLVRFAGDGGLPRHCGGSAPATPFRGLLDVRSRCAPHGPLPLREGRFLVCFRPFVTS